MAFYKIFKVSKNKSLPLDHLYYGKDCAERHCLANMDILSGDFDHFDILCKPNKNGKWFRCSQIWKAKEPIGSDPFELSVD